MAELSLFRLLVLLLLVQCGCGFIYAAGGAMTTAQKRTDPPAFPLKRPARYWNDDLYPCIEKYCGQYVSTNTNMYVRCLSKFCQRGVLTVPARDLDQPDTESVVQLDVHNHVDVNAHEEVLNAFVDSCQELQCPFDDDVRAFWTCAMSKCIPEEPTHIQDEADDTASLLKKAISRLQAVAKPAKRASNRRRLPGSVCTEERLGEPGCSWKELYERKHAPLARKRRVNDDVSQCIQSYCGNLIDRQQRLVCVIKNCHRIRRFN